VSDHGQGEDRAIGHPASFHTAGADTFERLPPDTPQFGDASPGDWPTTPSRVHMLVLDEGTGDGTATACRFSRKGYEVTVVQDGREALRALELANGPGSRTRYSILVCDAQAPAEREADFVARALALDPDLRILLSSRRVRSRQGGGPTASSPVHHLLQPMRTADVVRAVDEALGRHPTPAWQRAAMSWEDVGSTSAWASDEATLRETPIRVAETLIAAMEAKHAYLRGHSRRVGALAAEVAERLGLEPEVVEQVRLAGRLHDIGKLGVREEVLNKVAPLAAEEFAHIQTHVAIGVAILAPLRPMGRALTFIGDQSERWDGTGYPARLVGEAISIGGRIVAAADAFDALTSERPYRPALSMPDAISLMETLAGRLLDPAVFAALKEVVLRRSAPNFANEP